MPEGEKDVMVEVSAKRLKELERRDVLLTALEAGGVDNWDGYDWSLEDHLPPGFGD